MSTSAETPALDRFTGGGFARDPDPALALAALREFLAGLDPEQGPHPGVFYMFHRASRLYPAVAAAFRDELGELAGAARQVIEMALDPPLAPDPMTIEIHGPIDLDVLWGEFL